MFAFSSDENVSGSACHRMIAWCDGNSPKVVVIVRLLNARKRDAAKYLDAKDKSSLQKNTLKSPGQKRILNELNNSKRRKLPNADVVHGSRTEARVEVLCSQRFEVLDDPRPQMKNIVSEEDCIMQNQYICKAINLVNEVLFSMTVTLAPKSCASMAVLKPQGPAPTTVT